MRAHIFAGACVAAFTALCFTPAMADGMGMNNISGYVDGSYGYQSFAGESGHIDNYGVGGGLSASVATNWTVQGNLNYSEERFSGGGSDHIDNYGVGLSAFYSLSAGRLGANANYAHESISSLTFETENGGVFGDWFVSDVLTLSARGGFAGGKISGGGSSISLKSSNYIGGQLVGYPCPNLALTGTAENFHVSLGAGGISESITQADFSVGAEYLISKTTPVSVSLGYTDSNIGVAGQTVVGNTYKVGLKYYFGAGGSLRDRQRSGSESWGSSNPATSLLLAIF